MEIFSDARVVAPLIKTAEIHAAANPDSTFLYVFSHPTRHGYYPQVRTRWRRIGVGVGVGVDPYYSVSLSVGFSYLDVWFCPRRRDSLRSWDALGWGYIPHEAQLHQRRKGSRRNHNELLVQFCTDRVSNVINDDLLN